MPHGLRSRRFPTRRIVLLSTFFVASLALAASPERTDLKKWPDGPVRYLIEHSEVKMFRALETDEERVRFIDTFWKRRDPITETPENEYRRLFWSRVKEADERFTDSAVPGWKTDRGRIHVLCGPPTRIEDTPNADVTRTSPTAGHGLVRWVYEGRPCGRTDLGPVAIVAFTRSVSGEYQISTDPRLSALVFNAHDLTDPMRFPLDRFKEMISMPSRSELDVMMDLGKLQEAPHPEEILLDRIETIETYGSHPLAIETDRFRHPKGGTLVVLTVAVPGDGTEKPSILARFTRRDPARTSHFLAEESFRVEGQGARRVAQARLLLEPGLWDLSLISAEPAATTSGLYKGTLEVAPREGRLALSDLVLARTLEPVAYASLVSYDEPYCVGAFRVVPRVARSVARGESVQVFHEIYAGTGPYRISYQLEGKEDDGRFTPLGRPTVQEQEGISSGWSVPVEERWPTGDYQVRIRVQDSKEATTEATVPFTVVAP